MPAMIISKVAKDATLDDPLSPSFVGMIYVSQHYNLPPFAKKIMSTNNFQLYLL